MATASLSDPQAAGSPGPFVLVVIGAGPTCTYLLERLAAVTQARAPAVALEVHVFDRHGHFGSGQNHSSRQPRTSVLNRICGQIALGADETSPGVAKAPSLARFASLHDWCRARFAATADHRYALEADSWPRRYLFGEAIEEAFGSYIAHLERIAGVPVRCYADEAVDVVPSGEGRLTVVSAKGRSIAADHIVFATGHGAIRPRRGSPEAGLAALSTGGRRTFVPYAYPLDCRIPADASGPEKVVCTLGLGLTAIDVILHLTEGRGGQFRHTAEGLTYVPSGGEPRAIVGCSPSGLLTHARGVNQKEADPARLEHRAVFFTCDAIDRLRRAAGRPIDIPGIGRVRQLDFDSHLLPLLMLEMRFIYYRALLGRRFAKRAQVVLSPEVERFVARPAGDLGAADPFPAAFEPVVAEGLAAIERYLASGDISGAPDGHEMLESYFRAVLAPQDWADMRGKWASPATVRKLQRPGLRSRDNRPIGPACHRFDWERLSDPLAGHPPGDSAGFTAAAISFMKADHARAAQGNLGNPWKAACDGVWRDLRPILTYAVDHGGLSARSHARFLGHYMRLHNRLANGACLEVMEKMLALVECGLLDLGTGPLQTVRGSRDGDRFAVVGTAGTRDVDTVIDAKLHPFDPQVDEGSLYPNMLSRSLLRRWRNPEPDGPGFEPGGLDLSPRFHPVDANGAEDRRMTFLGPPSEGIVFFQVGAARPFQNHHVLGDVIAWVEEFAAQLDARHAA